MRRLPLALLAACLPLSVQAAGPRGLAEQIAAATEVRTVMDSWSGRQTGVMLLSTPRGIGQGFCRVDALKPIFDGPVDWSRPFEGGAKVVGFDAETYYYAAPPPAACDAPAPALAAMFTAPMDAWVTMAWNVLDRVREEAGAGTLPVACDDGSAARCRAEIAAVDVGSLRQIERCDPREDRSNYACFMYVVGGLILRVTFPVAGGDIKRVEVERQPSV
ncbi:MAG: hypothetical protein ACOY4K_14425 [Pseudomonadota bacterium]